MSTSSLPDLSTRAHHAGLDPALRTVLEDLSEGVLVVDIAGARLFSNPSLDRMLGRDACSPAGAVEAPPWLPADQRQKYMLALQASSSILTMDGSGRASTSLEVFSSDGGRAALRVTILSAGSAGQRHFSIWLLRDCTEVGAPGAIARAVPHGSGAALLPVVGGQGADNWVPLAAVNLLTPRERDVVALLMEGRRVSSIARLLYVSPQTVRNHLKSIFRKLGAHSQADLLDWLRGPPTAASEHPGAGASANGVSG